MDYSILVNKDNKLPDKYLVNLHLDKYQNFLGKQIYMEMSTCKQFIKLKNFLEKKDIFIDIDTAYRDINEQEIIQKEYQKKYGDIYTDKYVAPPGYSEHHTGLAIDIVLKKDDKYITEDDYLLEEIDQFKILHKYLKDFGFILRYPKNKEKITGYAYEPWHIRYVGTYIANVIYKNNITLEEYYNIYRYNGFLVINKESGPTSRDVVNEVEKILRTRKIGHTGTLDPLASGILILAVGKATKLSRDITAEKKEYIATVKVGIETDTLDITGNILNESMQSVPDNLEEILLTFEKTYMQEVPKYSAIKVNGKKLYEYARNNEEVLLPKKEVTIEKIELIEKSGDSFKFRCVVSKGTYIRSLIRDIAKELNIYATMSDLIRTEEFNYRLEDSYTVEDVRNGNYKILAIDEAFNYPVIDINYKLYKKISSGMTIENKYNILDKVIFKFEGNIVAIYEANGDILKCYYMN